MISKALIRQRIDHWVKTHPDGGLYDFTVEFEYKLILDGKIIKTPFFQRERWFSEYLAWTDEMELKGAVWVLQPSDDVFINDDLDTLVLSRDAKVIGRTKKPKKSKDWIIEFQWLSEKEFNSTEKWFTNKNYTPKWQSNSYGAKFTTSTAALHSLKAKRGTFLGVDNYKGRNWRIRNLKTNQIIEYVPPN